MKVFKEIRLYNQSQGASSDLYVEVGCQAQGLI